MKQEVVICYLTIVNSSVEAESVFDIWAWWSEGDDQLKSSESHQLTFAFADNSKENGQASKADVSAGKACLLHQADLNLMKETDARTHSGLQTTLVVRGRLI